MLRTVEPAPGRAGALLQGFTQRTPAPLPTEGVQSHQEHGHPGNGTALAWHLDNCIAQPECMPSLEGDSEMAKHKINQYITISAGRDPSHPKPAGGQGHQNGEQSPHHWAVRPGPTLSATNGSGGAYLGHNLKILCKGSGNFLRSGGRC